MGSARVEHLGGPTAETYWGALLRIALPATRMEIWRTCILYCRLRLGRAVEAVQRGDLGLEPALQIVLVRFSERRSKQSAISPNVGFVRSLEFCDWIHERNQRGRTQLQGLRKDVSILGSMIAPVVADASASRLRPLFQTAKQLRAAEPVRVLRLGC